MKKRVLSLLLTLCLTLGLFGFTVPTAAGAGVKPTTEGTYGENITRSFDVETGVLTIGGTGNMPGGLFEHVRPDWQDFAEQIVEAVILDGVTSIGNSCFLQFPVVPRLSLKFRSV